MHDKPVTGTDPFAQYATGQNPCRHEAQCCPQLAHSSGTDLIASHGGAGKCGGRDLDDEKVVQKNVTTGAKDSGAWSWPSALVLGVLDSDSDSDRRLSTEVRATGTLSATTNTSTCCPQWNS